MERDEVKNLIRRHTCENCGNLFRRSIEKEHCNIKKKKPKNNTCINWQPYDIGTVMSRLAAAEMDKQLIKCLEEAVLNQAKKEGNAWS